MYRRPCAELIGILPDVEKGADIFSQPDEEADQHERKEQWHLALAVVGPEDDGRARVQPQRAGREIPAVVADVMMGEKIGVNEDRDQRGHPVRRVVLLAHNFEVRRQINMVALGTQYAIVRK